MKVKNSIKRSILVLMAVIMLVSGIPFTASAVSANVTTTYNYLVGTMGLNSAAACGVLANIEYESDFNPNLTGDYGTSYGICQWHNERWDNLKSYCNRNGYDWRSLNGQLHFLQYELTYCTGDTGSTLSKLKAASNTAQGAYQAASDWCRIFERPANVNYEAEKRGSRARDYYWPIFKNETGVNLGDVNSDSKINSSDALTILKYTVREINLTSNQIKAADLNKDNKVNSQDALIVLNISIGKASINSYK